MITRRRTGCVTRHKIAQTSCQGPLRTRLRLSRVPEPVCDKHDMSIPPVRILELAGKFVLNHCIYIPVAEELQTLSSKTDFSNEEPCVACQHQLLYDPDATPVRCFSDVIEIMRAAQTRPGRMSHHIADTAVDFIHLWTSICMNVMR